MQGVKLLDNYCNVNETNLIMAGALLQSRQVYDCLILHQQLRLNHLLESVRLNYSFATTNALRIVWNIMKLISVVLRVANPETTRAKESDNG